MNDKDAAVMRYGLKHANKRIATLEAQLERAREWGADARNAMTQALSDLQWAERLFGGNLQSSILLLEHALSTAPKEQK